MREIKFRAWNSEKKYMTYLFNPVSHGDINIFDFYFLRGWRGEGLIPMQYTGLNDKNGKEIYEGDIFPGDNDDPIKYVICWLDCGSWGFHPAGDPDMATLIMAGDEMEIIGNIYENPELIPK